MMKKIIAMMLVLLLAVSCFAACGEKAPTESKEPSAKDPVEIEFLTWWPGEIGEEYYNNLVAEFEAENPGITVKIANQPFGEVQKLAVSNHIAQQATDIIGMNPPWTREFYDKGMLAPLDDLIANDSTYNKDNYTQASFTPIDGKTYLAPVDSQAFFLYVNKDMFDKAGIAYPTSWDEMRDAAKALTSGSNYGFTMVLSESSAANGSILSLYPLLYSANGRTNVDGKFTVQTEEMTAALTLIDNMNKDGSLLPGTTSKSEFQIVEEFSNGNIAMMIENNAHIATLAGRDIDFNYEIIPIPSMDGTAKPETRHHGWDVAISSQSKHKEEAWKFISFMTNKANMGQLGIEGNKVPGFIDIDKTYMADNAPLQQAADIIADYDMVEELSGMPSAGSCWTELTKAGSAVINGTKSVEQALADCQAKWDEILKQ